MTPQAIIIAELLLRYGPGLAAAVVEIFKKKEPSLEDWEKVFELARRPYDWYVPELPEK